MDKTQICFNLCIPFRWAFIVVLLIFYLCCCLIMVKNNLSHHHQDLFCWSPELCQCCRSTEFQMDEIHYHLCPAQYEENLLWKVENLKRLVLSKKIRINGIPSKSILPFIQKTCQKEKRRKEARSAKKNEHQKQGATRLFSCCSYVFCSSSLFLMLFCVIKPRWNVWWHSDRMKCLVFCDGGIYGWGLIWPFAGFIGYFEMKGIHVYMVRPGFNSFHPCGKFFNFEQPLAPSSIECDTCILAITCRLLRWQLC